MADMTKGFKGIWMKSMEAISDTASKIATNTKYKVDEMNIVNRRAEILKNFGAKSYELWQKGEQFPAELDVLLNELHQLETELAGIRAEKASSKPAAPVAPAEETVKEETETFEEKAEAAAEEAAIAEDPEESIPSDDEAVEVGDDAVPTIEVAEETIIEEVGETLPDQDSVPEIKVEE